MGLLFKSIIIFQKNVDKRREERGAIERERSGGRRHYVGGRELDRRARRHRESARDRDRNKEDKSERERGKERERRYLPLHMAALLAHVHYVGATEQQGGQRRARTNLPLYKASLAHVSNNVGHEVDVCMWVRDYARRHCTRLRQNWRGRRENVRT